MTEDLLVERFGDGATILVIRFNRPEKKNAITRDMYLRLNQALRAAGEDPAVRAVVFFGSPGCFSAGNDIKDFAAAAMAGGLGAEVLGFLHALVDCQKPMLSGVDGLAVGIGATLHFHCDLTVASPQSRFRTPFVDLALVPEAGSSLIAPRLMGHQRAFSMLVLGEDVTGEEALAHGLVARLAPSAEVEALTLSLAQRLAEKPAQALALSRDLLRGSRTELHGRIDEEAALFSQQLTSVEAKQAFERFFRR